MGFKVAVVGATGNVGREILTTLAERDFPVDEVVALASSRSVGKEVSFGEDDVLKVQNLETFDFHGIDIVLSSPGAKVSAQFAPRATKAGAVVIDNTSQFRMEPDVPLVVPEVNPKAIGEYQKRGIIANPNCSTIQMVVALKPLHDAPGSSGWWWRPISRLPAPGARRWTNCSTRPARSSSTTRSSPSSSPSRSPSTSSRTSTSSWTTASTKEEWKMAVETRKILDPDIAVTATCVRVPVFIGHAEAVNVEFEQPLSEAARAALRRAPASCVVDHRADEGYVTPIEAAGEDAVYVSRMRSDPTVPNGLSFGCRRQSAQRGGAQRGADRRDPGLAEHLGGKRAPARSNVEPLRRKAG